MKVSKQLVAGMIAGSLAGLFMAAAMMAYMHATGRSAWTNPNLIAALWTRQASPGGKLTTDTIAGFAVHLGTSATMGMIAIPFIADLPGWRTILVAVAYSLASYPLVLSAVISWADRPMFNTSNFIPLTAAHALYGIVLGSTFLLIASRTGRASPT